MPCSNSCEHYSLTAIVVESCTARFRNHGLARARSEVEHLPVKPALN